MPGEIISERRARSNRNGGRHHPGMPGEIISERRARSNRNGGRHHRGFAGDFPRNPQSVGMRLVDLQTDEVLFDALSPGRSDASYEDVFIFGGRSYGIKTAPTSLYTDQHRSLQSWAVLMRGIVGTSLLGAL